MRKQLILPLCFCLAMLTLSCKDKSTEPAPPTPPTPEQPDEPDGPDKPAAPLTAVPFHKGFNLSGWLNLDGQYYNPDTYTEKEFDELKSLGVDVVRVPLKFQSKMGAAPEYTFSNDYLLAIDKAVKMATDRGMYIILDQHGYGTSFDPEIDEAIVTSGLRQLAARYKKYDDHVILELFNEPNGTYLKNYYYEIQGRLIKAIREIDKNRILVVTTPQCNYTLLDLLPDYGDERLLYTFHFYDPVLFTHQGAAWQEAPEKYVKGIPFPYNDATMPKTMPSQIKGTYLETDFRNYSSIGTAEWVGAKLQSVKDWAVKNGNKPMFCGEFGALDNATQADRCAYYKVVCDKLAEMGMGWTAWQYRGDFSVFEGNGIFELDLNTELIKAMGLTVPEGVGGDTPTLNIYQDILASWLTREKIDNFNIAWTDKPHTGTYCIRWDIASRSSEVQLTMWPVLDLSKYAEAGAKLQFAVRSKDPINNLEIRLQQYDANAAHQWRNCAYLSTLVNSSAAGKYTNDGQWHIVSIPLKDFYIKGTMSGDRDHPEEGEPGFAWKCINKIELSAADNSLHAGKIIFFDDIKIVK